MRWDEGWTKSETWGCPCHRKNISKKYKRQSLGMPKASPSPSTKISGHLSRHYIFIASYDMCYSWSVNFFCFKFCFVCCSIWLDPSIFVLERDTLRFHCLEHSSFHSYYSVSVHFLLVLCLALVFHSYFVKILMFCFSYIWLALWSLMIIIYESCFKYVNWCCRRVKYFMLIVAQYESCLFCGLVFGISC